MSLKAKLAKAKASGGKDLNVSDVLRRLVLLFRNNDLSGDRVRSGTAWEKWQIRIK